MGHIKMMSAVQPFISGAISTSEKAKIIETITKTDIASISQEEAIGKLRKLITQSSNGVDTQWSADEANVVFNSDKDNFTLQVNSGDFTCKTVIGAYGKKSKIDKVLNRPFAKAKKLPENNFVGIKYHLKSEVPAKQIELHLFENGYAGISQIEDGKSCFCYLTTANQMQKVNGSIERLENEILVKNEHLKHYLNSSTKLFSPALSISQIEYLQWV